MKDILRDLGAILRRKTDAANIVPPSGISAWLIVFTAAAMTFLAVIAFAFASSSQRVANSWTEELASSLTVRISAPIDQMAAQTTTALQVLQTTPGIASARLIRIEEQEDLLEPWLGSGVDLEGFSLPQLIAVEETKEGADRESLRLRLEAEAPGAQLDDHGRWQGPLIDAATAMRNLGLIVLLLVLAGLLAVVILAVQAAIVSNSNNIATLRLIGARDAFIIQAFVRRITLRAMGGALIGTVAALLFVWFQPSQDAFPAPLTLVGQEWIIACVFVILVAVISFVASRIAAHFTLKRLT